MARKLFLVANEKYGNTDWVNHLKHASHIDDYDVCYLGRGVSAGKDFYPSKIHIFGNSLSLIKGVCSKLRSLDSKDENVIIIRYFRYAIILNIIVVLLKYFVHSKCTVALDIRTVPVQRNKFTRRLDLVICKLTARTFTHKFVISDAVSKAIGISKCYRLPLASDDFSRDCKVSKLFTPLKFVYVGAINRPGVFETLIRIADCLRTKNIDYLIDVYALSEPSSSDQTKIQDFNINFCGPLNRRDFSNILSSYHVGLSPLPDMPVYDIQPHTKLFEYVAVGLPFLTKKTSGVLEQFDGCPPGWLYKTVDEINTSFLMNIIEEYDFFALMAYKFEVPLWKDVYLKYLQPVFRSWQEFREITD
ncbi:MAG: hypothetical protein CMQ37_10395 [Gammaproteobacteria bacterium]|nr:hypothetical protein [Gammaproteobacteria bacterium]|tara:strand:- start:7251 stop:8330 length:1080 start_codon:yes stop_codon:yes gene_type:complete